MTYAINPVAYVNNTPWYIYRWKYQEITALAFNVCRITQSLLWWHSLFHLMLHLCVDLDSVHTSFCLWKIITVCNCPHDNVTAHFFRAGIVWKQLLNKLTSNVASFLNCQLDLCAWTGSYIKLRIQSIFDNISIIVLLSILIYFHYNVLSKFVSSIIQCYHCMVVLIDASCPRPFGRIFLHCASRIQERLQKMNLKAK